MTSQGLDYFPFSTDFFDDDKIALIEAEFGEKGAYIAIRLLCKIYGIEGYYCRWGKDELLLFARKLGGNFSSGLVQEVVSGLVSRSFFDKGVYDSFGVLTSRGIQIRFLEGAKRRQEVRLCREYLLVDVSKMKNISIFSKNVNISSENVDNSGQSKESNERKNSSSFSSSFPSDGKIEAEEKQQEEFLSILFFRNYAAPSRELRKFIAYNNTGGRKWDKMSYKERRSALDLWKQEPATKRVDDQFLLYWQAVFKQMISLKAPHPIIMAALDDRVNARVVNGNLILDVPDIIREYIERNLDHFKAVTHQFMRKKRIQPNSFTYHIIDHDNQR